MSLVSELRADAFSARALPALSSGLVSGVYILIYVIVASLVLGSALLWGDLMLMSIPVPLVGGLLVFIGLVLLDDWLMRSFGVLPWTEYAIVLLMFVTIVGFGFLEGVGIGMMVTTAFFAVRLSRVELIEARFTARDRHSNKIRPRHGRGAAERLAASDDGPGVGIRFHGCAAVPVWSG